MTCHGTLRRKESYFLTQNFNVDDPMHTNISMTLNKKKKRIYQRQMVEVMFAHDAVCNLPDQIISLGPLLEDAECRF